MSSNPTFNSVFNYKGTLQEYCQKNRIDMPTYTHKKVGEDHSPMFLAEVKVGNSLFRSNYQTRLSKAEQEAAANALFHLKVF